MNFNAIVWVSCLAWMANIIIIRNCYFYYITKSATLHIIIEFSGP